ncbi:MipA/OmpV family protein [Oxalobacteraceae bacterium A2-2]
MNKLPLPSLTLLLLPVCSLAHGGDRLPMMPDGSRDMYVGAALATSSSAAADATRPVVLRPLLQVEWSNGVFVSSVGAAGWHLSQTAGVEYGPLLLSTNARDPGDNRRLRGSHAISGSLDAGGFFNYYLGDSARLRSSMVYDTSAHGVRGELGVQKSWAELAPHHSVSLYASLALASDPVMRERYEVRRDAGGVRDYRPDGGVAALAAGANWNWSLSSQWLLASGVTATRLGSGPAGSPVVERRTYVTWSTGLAYRF